MEQAQQLVLLLQTHSLTQLGRGTQEAVCAAAQVCYRWVAALLKTL